MCFNPLLMLLLVVGCWFVQVKLTFEEPEAGVTIVKLVQTDVPEEDRFVVLG